MIFGISLLVGVLGDFLSSDSSCPPDVRPQNVQGCAALDSGAHLCEQSFEGLRNADPLSACWWHPLGMCRSGARWAESDQGDRLRAQLRMRGCPDWKEGERLSTPIIDSCEGIPGWNDVALWRKTVDVCSDDPFASPAPEAALTCVGAGSARQAAGKPRRKVSTGNKASGPAQSFLQSLLRRRRCAGRTLPPGKTLIVFDHTCNGCGITKEGSQNIWHRMTRMFTVWRAARAVACAAAASGRDCSTVPLGSSGAWDLAHAARNPGPGLSESNRGGWQALAPSGQLIGPDPLGRLDWCAYSRVVVVPKAPDVGFMIRHGVNFHAHGADKLWALSLAPHAACFGSTAADMWRGFVRDLRAGIGAPRQQHPSLWSRAYASAPKALTTPGRVPLAAQAAEAARVELARVELCVFVRAPRRAKAGEGGFPRWIAELDGTEAVLARICQGTSRLRVREVLLASTDTLRSQVAQLAPLIRWRSPYSGVSK